MRSAVPAFGLRGVERGLGAETGCGEPEPVGAGRDLGVLVIGDADGATFLPAGRHVGTATRRAGGSVVTARARGGVAGAG
jgi:hypothetical protein